MIEGSVIHYCALISESWIDCLSLLPVSGNRIVLFFLSCSKVLLNGLMLVHFFYNFHAIFKGVTYFGGTAGIVA